MRSATATDSTPGVALPTSTASDAGRRDLLLFVSLAVATLAVYALLWLPPLWLFRFPVFVDDNPDIGSILGKNPLGIIHYVVLIALPFGLYLAALRLVPRLPRRQALAGTVLVGVLAPLLLLLTYPAFAADLFDYLISARLLVAYHANPYTVPPQAIPYDPYFPPVVWRHLLSVYGPLWLWLSAWPVKLAGAHRLLALLLVKATVVVAHLGTAAVLYQIVARRAPERAPGALLAYLWNPLVIFSVAIDGHNDAVMLFFLIAALWLALERSWRLALPALTLGVLTKFIPLICLPLFLLAGRRERRQLLIGLGISLVLIAGLYAPFWAGWRTLDGVRSQGNRLTSSPASLLGHLVPADVLHPLFAALFALGFVLLLRRVRPLPERCFGVIVLYLATLCFWSKGWYVSWPLALGAIVGGDALIVTIAASFGALVANIFWGWMLPMDWFGLEGRWDLLPLDITMALSLYLPWLLGGLWAWRRHVARRLPRQEEVGIRPPPVFVSD